KHVLKLKPLDPVDAEIGAAARGSLVHELLDRFTATYPDTLPQDALDRLLQMIEERLGPELSARPAGWAVWRPRLDRIARWFLATERESRQRTSLVATEVKGTLTLDLSAGPFVVAAKADRIDRLERGGLAIIDYKTGVVPKLPAVLAG